MKSDCDLVRERFRLTVQCCKECHAAGDIFEWEVRGETHKVCCGIATEASKGNDRE